MNDYSSRHRSSKSPRQERRRSRRAARSAERVEAPLPAEEPIRPRRRVDRPLPTERPAKEETPKEVFAPAWLAVARGVALFLGAFLLIVLLGEVRGASQGANLGWIDLSPASAEIARGFLGVCCALLLLFAVHPAMPQFLRGLAILAVLTLFGVALWNAYIFYQQLRDGDIRTAMPVAFPLHIAACLAVVFSGLTAHRGRSSNPGRDLFLAMLTIALCVVSFPLAQFFCQGKVDYRRASDVAVVFAFDTPSGADLEQTLAPRVRTACRLYEEKLVRKLVLACGTGEEGEQKADIMRRVALAEGIPEVDLISDSSGTAVEAAVKGTLEKLEQNDLHTALVVSDFYLLPRIKLCYRRFGKEVDTVPAKAADEPNEKEQPRVPNEALVREASDLWIFYLQPLVF